MFQKQQININFSKLLFGFFSAILLLTTLTNPVLAQDISDVSKNMITNIAGLPGLITGIAYLIGVVFAFRGILSLKAAVDQPGGSTTIRHGAISLAIAGTMFALPIIYESMTTLIQDNPAFKFAPDDGGAITKVSRVSAKALGVGTQTFAHIMGNITRSVEDVPGLITGVAYMLGLIFGVAGLLKIKDHVDEPGRTTMKEGIVRLIVGGMLFSIPTIYQALLELISDGGVNLLAAPFIALTSTGLTTEAAGFGCGGTVATATIATFGGTGGFGLGYIMCNLFISTSPGIAFLTAMAYLFGLVVGLWGILKIKEHVENPGQISIWDPVAKLVVAGGFFVLPYLVGVIYTTVAAFIVPHSNALNGEVRASAGNPEGLDVMIGALVNDTFMPLSVVVNGFALIAGFVLVFIGISRLMKSAQEGARGPGGIGTIMTFITGGALLAFGPMVTAIGTSLLAADGINTPNQGTLRYTSGMDPNAVARAHTVLDAIILFVAMVGLVSIARGIFIMRGVSEGNSQASSMAGITHLLGGALAVNLGPVLNAVQNTLGIPALGLGLAF